MVRFSEFLGIGYFGDEKLQVIAPIFDTRYGAEKGWTRVMEGRPAFHVVFVEHQAKYEFIAYPLAADPGSINYALYRSFSSLASLQKFKAIRGGRTYIKFGWHDLTKPQKFDVMAGYATADGVEFLGVHDVVTGTMADRIRRNEL
jgi:hypothetical protein